MPVGELEALGPAKQFADMKGPARQGQAAGGAAHRKLPELIYLNLKVLTLD